jgi:hypothetical protein
MLSSLIKIIFTICLVFALKAAYYHYTVGEFDSRVDIEFEEYDPDDYRDDDDEYAYDDYDTESDW